MELHELAEEIQRLNREVERLRNSRDEMYHLEREANEGLRAENERLRGILEREEKSWLGTDQKEWSRLRRIEEAARLIADQGQGLEEYDALRAALEEK